jgi:hypothetical protein
MEGQNVGVQLQWTWLAIRKRNGGQVIKRGCEQLGFEALSETRCEYSGPRGTGQDSVIWPCQMLRRVNRYNLFIWTHYNLNLNALNINVQSSRRLRSMDPHGSFFFKLVFP